jgi:integrase
MKKETFPLLVRSGSVAVKIYRVQKRGAAAGVVYAMAWVDHTRGRLLRQFADLDQAKDEARLLAEKLAKGQIDAGDFSANDRAELMAARQIVARVGVPITTALEEWIKAREIAGGAIIPAAEAWVASRRLVVDHLTVREVIERFLAAKTKAGVDVSCSYDKILPHLVTGFGAMPIADVSAQALAGWLETIRHPVTRNTARKRMVTVWRWARRIGFLPRNVQTEAELTDRARESAPVVGIISPETFSAVLGLMREKHPHYLAAAVLAGLCGLRRSEVHHQIWEDIHLDRGLLNVSHAKRGTPARRLVQLCPAAVAWLRLIEIRVGLVCPNQTIDRLRDIAKTAGHVLPQNCFRHSYISHRVAATGNVPETALEAGNSVSKIHRHYRELVTKEQGCAWFEIQPVAGLAAA